MPKKLRPEFLAGHASVVLITVDEVAHMLGVGSHTVWRRLKKDGKFPKPIKQGKRCTRWQRADVNNYITSLAA